MHAGGSFHNHKILSQCVKKCPITFSQFVVYGVLGAQMEILKMDQKTLQLWIPSLRSRWIQSSHLILRRTKRQPRLYQPMTR